MTKDSLFDWIYREFKDPVYRTCRFYVQDPQARQDLFQDIFMNIWRGIDSIQNPDAIRTWVYRISTNTAITRIREEKGLRDKNSQLMADVKSGSDPFQPESHENLENQKQLMFSCINELPASDKMLIGLVLEELSTIEMAEITGLSEANVRVKIHRIKKKIKEIMEAKQYGLERDL